MGAATQCEPPRRDPGLADEAKTVTLSGHAALAVQDHEAGQPDSATSLQIWWIRLALLVKLRLFTTAEAEAAGLWECDRPDMFYQFYPEVFAGRRGSLAPWSLRLLLAELPMYNNKQVVTMNRLFRLQRSIRYQRSDEYKSIFIFILLQE